MTDALALVIGRFQPFHRGHDALCRSALETAPRLLIVLGSGGQAPDIRNPWSDGQRETMIRASLPDIAPERLIFAAVPDVLYDEAVWLGYVREAVGRASGTAPVTLFGHHKDASSYYLALFPEWQYREVPNVDGISATPQRERLLAADDPVAMLDSLREAFTDAGLAALRPRLMEPTFAALQAEYAAVQSFRAAWADAPYPPIFVTVDALVTCGDEVLLVQRGQQPGKNLWALPGGFLDVAERLEAGARRELQEETGLDLSACAHQLRGSRAYDAPDRSVRGRFVTHLFHFALDGAPPPVRGADDAAAARWWPVAELDAWQMFEDHYCIIQHALDRYAR